MSADQMPDKLLGEYYDACRELLMGLSDDDLNDLVRGVTRLRHELPRPATAALVYLTYSVTGEVCRRDGLVENARIAVESNGHEVYIGYDGCEEQGRDWMPFGSCRKLDHPCATYEEAVRLAGEHAADTGGQWEKGEPRAEADYR